MDEKERTPLYRAENGIATITLNRPETLNSFTTDFVHEIEDAIVHADADDDVRVLLLTGEGRGFTSGGNLQELAAMNLDRKRAIYDVDSTADMVRLLYNVKKPVIAAINGPAFGAGIALAMACDLLIASDRAQFGFSFTGLGFCPDQDTGSLDSIIKQQENRLDKLNSLLNDDITKQTQEILKTQAENAVEKLNELDITSLNIDTIKQQLLDNNSDIAKYVTSLGPEVGAEYLNSILEIGRASCRERV